ALGRQQRRQAAPAHGRACDVAGDDTAQEPAAVRAGGHDELAARAGAYDRLALEQTEIVGASHFFFIARSSRRRTARRARASAKRRRSTDVSSDSGGTARGRPSSSTATKVRNARVVWRRPRAL